jgi:hypothetical protein
MKNRASLAIVLATQLSLVTCYRHIRPVRAEPGQGFASLFDGFVYVGTNVDLKSHSNAGLGVPTSILSGREYFFHHTDTFDSLVFARTVLPERLQSLGFSVTQTVDQGSIAFMDPGGALWSVRFSRGACTGLIGTQRCMDLTSRKLFKDSRWVESDFVLTLQGQCSN